MSIAIEEHPSQSPGRVVPQSSARKLVHAVASRAWARTVLVSIALLVLLLVPRLSDLDALVTPDEPLWIGRSANFYEALVDRNFSATYQFVHPGVPVMWLGALGFFFHIHDLPYLMGQQLPVRDRTVQDLLQANGYSVLDVLVDLRQVVIVASALVVIALFICLTRIVDFWAAAATVAFLGLDPMHIGFTRLLHLDGLSANLMLLAVVAFSWYVQRKSMLALVLAGVVTGIACLTRAANAVAGPFFALIAFADVALLWRIDRVTARALARRYLLALIGIGLISFAVFVALWPAMWVSPIDTLSKLWSGSRDLTSDGGGRAIYFRGDISFNPGVFYYPVVVVYRLSPFTAVGLIIAILAVIRPQDIGARFNRALAGHLTLFSIVYLLIVTASSKKYDRYVLPSIVTLDLVAGLAWVSAAIWLGRKLIATHAQGARAAAVALVVVVLLGQGDYALRMRPFYIDAATPLLGGVSGAQDEFSFNWGEGGKEVAAALTQIPGIDSAVVYGGPWPKTIDYYLPIQIEQPAYTLTLDSAAEWIATDYVVLSYPEIQRQFYPPELLAWFQQQTPIATVNTIDGTYARIYDIRDVPPPDAFYVDAPKVHWDGVGTIVALDFNAQRTIGAKSLVFTLFVQPDPGAGEVVVNAEALAPDGTTVGTVTSSVPLTPGPDGLVEVPVRVPVSTDLPEANYELRYGFADPATGQPFAAVNETSGAALGETVSVGSVYIRPRPADADDTN